MRGGWVIDIDILVTEAECRRLQRKEERQSVVVKRKADGEELDGWWVRALWRKDELDTVLFKTGEGVGREKGWNGQE